MNEQKQNVGDIRLLTVFYEDEVHAIKMPALVFGSEEIAKFQTLCGLTGTVEHEFNFADGPLREKALSEVTCVNCRTMVRDLRRIPGMPYHVAVEQGTAGWFVRSECSDEAEIVRITDDRR